MGRSGMISVVWAGAISLALGAGACSGGGSAGAGNGGRDAGQDATTSSCTTDSQCAATVPPTTPANCATGKCNTLQGVCEYLAKDEDGDGHAVANCKSTGGVPVQDGDDCNDHDANLYPGHPETCTTAEDGGAASGVLCKPGLSSCLADGTQSPCVGTRSCAQAACVAEACVGSCTPGTTQCVGNGVETCSAQGGWSAPVPCGTTATCVTMSGAAQCAGHCESGNAACGGNNGVQICDKNGEWGSPVPCVSLTCIDGACLGSCAPGETACSNNGIVTCTTGGGWGTPVPCVNQTCVGGRSISSLDGGVSQADSGASGVPATCQGTCAPGGGCNGAQPQTCDATGQWQNAGASCSGATPTCYQGACVDCPPCPAGETCSNGICCPSAELNCGGVCTDPLTSNAHCGAMGACGAGGGSAGSACGAGSVCSGGVCSVSCQAGQIICNGSCTDPTTNTTYCGATGNCQGINAGVVCQTGWSCIGAKCTLVCQSGFLDCDNQCINPLTDNQFCGASGNNCVGYTTCSTGHDCTNGVCVLQTSCRSSHEVWDLSQTRRALDSTADVVRKPRSAAFEAASVVRTQTG